VSTAHFFAENILPRAESEAIAAMSGAPAVMALETEAL
jgi:hypothetical protein